MSRRKITKTTAFESVARSLREFGYPDVTAEMIADVWAAMEAGKAGDQLPHFIVGQFSESLLSEHATVIRGLPD